MGVVRERVRLSVAHVVVLAMTAGYTDSGEVRRVCYLMIDQIDAFLVIPGAFAALASGVLLSVVTPWGTTPWAATPAPRRTRSTPSAKPARA